jgi:hypothetical protein
MSKPMTVIGMLVILTFVGCGPSKQQEARKKQEASREASIAELKRVQAAFGDLQIAVDAGVLREEFSQRTNDTLVKIGDLKRSKELAESGFPTAEDKVAEIYLQFSHAADVYTLSKQFFGPNPAADDAFEVDMLSNSEYEMLQGMFPDAAKQGGYFSIASRSETVKGLWRLAEEDTKTAGDLIGRLSTSLS